MTIQGRQEERPAGANRSSMFLTWYVVLVICAGAGILLWSWMGVRDTAVPMTVMAFWLVLSLAAEVFWLPTPGGAGMVSMSLAANMAVLFVLPRPHALTVIGISIALSDLLLHNRTWVKSLFNPAQGIIAAAAASWAMHLFGVPDGAPGSAALLLYPTATLVTLPAFVIPNTFLVAGAIALSRRESIWRTWLDNYGFGYQQISSLALFLVGLGIVIGVERVGYVSGLAVLAILLILRDAYRYQIRRRSRPCP